MANLLVIAPSRCSPSVWLHWQQFGLPLQQAGADITLRIGRQHHSVALAYPFRHLFAFGDNDIAHFVTRDPRIRDHLKGPTLCVKITATLVQVWHNGLPGSLRQDR